MKLESIQKTRSQRLRAPEVARPEGSEQIDFNLERDLTPEQKAAMFQGLKEFREMGKWINYLELYVQMRVLWPEIPGEPPVNTIPLGEVINIVQELEKKNKQDLRLKVAANLKALGLPIEGVLAPSAIPDILAKFDRRLVGDPRNIELISDSLNIARLGLRPVAEVFQDPAKGWEVYVANMEIYRHAMRKFLADFGGCMKLLFPQRVSEIPISSKEIRSMIVELRRMEPQFFLVVPRYAIGLSLLTAGEVSFGPHGEYVIQKHKVSVGQKEKLPARDLT